MNIVEGDVCIQVRGRVNGRDLGQPQVPDKFQFLDTLEGGSNFDD